MRDYLATVLSVGRKYRPSAGIISKRSANWTIQSLSTLPTRASSFGEHGWFDKRFMYEECQRMPLIIRYPKAIKAGSTSNAICMNVDFAPTFLDFAGVGNPIGYSGTSPNRYWRTKARPADWRKAATTIIMNTLPSIR